MKRSKNLATCNIGTMLGQSNSNRHEKRNTMISKEIQKYSIDTAALSEVRFAGSGSIREETDYIFYQSGKTSTDKSEPSVAFVVRNSLLSRISEDLKGVRRQTKSSFLEIFALELANHIIPGRRFLVNLERRRLISKAICCHPSAQNTSWSLAPTTSNTRKSTRTSDAPMIQTVVPHLLHHHTKA